MNKQIQQLYRQFLKGKISIDEFRVMKNSIERLSDEILSDEMQKVWEEESSLPRMQPERKNLLYKKISHEIKPVKRYSITNWSRIAAVSLIIVLLNLSAWIILKDRYTLNQHTFVTEVAAGEKAKLTLSDGSSVKVNSESILSYSFHPKEKRKVDLDGEAFFVVAKDEKQPFIVQVGDLQIEVTGTSFNVRSYIESDEIETTLLEGSIRLSSEKMPQPIDLRPSQKAIYSKSNGSLRIEHTNNRKETVWTQDILMFEQESLLSVFAKIERWYGVSIEFNPDDILYDTLTGSFKNEQLTYVMEALRIQYGLEYTIQGNHIRIHIPESSSS